MSDPVIVEDEDIGARPPRIPPQPLLPEGAGVEQLSDVWQEATTPLPPGAEGDALPDPAPEEIAAPPKRTPEEIAAELGLPPPRRDLAPLPDNDATTWDVMVAAFRSEVERTDWWNATESRRRDLSEDMWNLLSKEGRARVEKERGRNGWASIPELITAEAARQAATSPDVARVWAGYPLSIEEFDRRIDSDRRATIDEAQAILDQPGGTVAEFLGSAAAAISDKTSLMLLPLGISSTGWKMIASEAALGALGEAAVLPREYRVAEELGLEDPNPVSRIAMGAAFGGGFAAALHGLGRGVTAFRARAEARRASLHETQPEGVDRIDHEAEVEAAEAWLRGDQTVEERLGGSDEAAEPTAANALPPVGPDAPANWEKIRNGIFAGESGADWNALFAYQNRKGGKFSHIKATEMTVDEWLAFQDPSGPYGQWVARNRPDPQNGVATPMGAYQIVGTTLRAAKKALGLKGDEVMTAEMQDYIAQWIYRQQGASAWVGYKGPRDSYTPGSVDGPAPTMGPTSRGYTGSGQVTAGDDFRIDVDWQVVDAATLLRASGDLQPRDRSRINSDAWIADTAARLDPAQLMPSPTADRGAPIVGPDNVIESGNGRFGAIERAYERHPDRAAVYRSAIEGAGFDIPEGVERPILIARRKTDLSREDRARFAIEAQDSGVAVMTPTEMARAHGRAMTAPVLARMDPTQPLRSDANGDFVRSVLQNLPRSARNAMFGADGIINAAGERQLREAIFARAWPDPDILARFTEGDSGELKSLLEALDRAAPAWAALKADIEAGLVRAEMDISAFVLDAMRMIDAARTLSKRDGLPVAKAVQELLDSPDLLDGPVAPLTVALLRKFWKDGRAAKADDVADFLTRYANDARKAGAEGGMFDAPGPREVLRAIDPGTFGDLPEEIGRARGFARPGQEAPPDAVADLPGEDFDQGAQSPGAEAVDAEIAAELRGPSTEERLAEAMASDPSLQEALDRQAQVPLTTDLPGYGTDAFWQQRKYVAADGSEIAGLSAAVEHLTDVSRRLAWSDEGLPPEKIRSERQAVILIGPPASGKSTIANPLARDLGAAIVDVDEAKKLIPEYGRGEGANAVHSESVEITEGVLEEVLAAGDNIVLPKVGGKLTSIQTTIATLKHEGYTVRLVEVVAPAEVAIARMVGRARATGRVIPPEIMREGIDGAPVTYQLLKERGEADGYARIDNTPGLGQPRAVLEDDSEILHAFDGRDRGDRTAQHREAEGAAESQARSQGGQDGLTAEAEPDAIAAARSDLGEFADIEVELPDGTRVRAGDVLDDLDADRAADEALDTCILDPAATFSKGGGA